jgi:hypothetical protein
LTPSTRQFWEWLLFRESSSLLAKSVGLSPPQQSLQGSVFASGDLEFEVSKPGTGGPFVSDGPQHSHPIPLIRCIFCINQKKTHSSLFDDLFNDDNPQQKLATLPVKFTGLAIPDLITSSHPNYEASTLMCSHLITIL